MKPTIKPYTPPTAYEWRCALIRLRYELALKRYAEKLAALERARKVA